MTTASIDQEKMGAFIGKVLTDTSATATTLLAALGDRLGLWTDLAANGPATSAELAGRTRTQERYTREWLGAMAAAGYLEYDPGTQQFTLPPEHVPALAQEAGPYFFGGPHQMLVNLVDVLGNVEQAFRAGGGVHQSSYPAGWWEGMDRFTSGWFENLLVPVWVPLVPDVQAKLEAGAYAADVGCGGGRALNKLAEAFPNSRFVGYDVFEPSILRARERAAEAGVDDRVSFEVLDVSKGLPEQYDVVFTFDVVHDAADPVALLGAVRAALRDGGIYVCLDMNCSDKVEGNFGPLGALFYGFSVLYCMTTSLANGGAGLGTCGFHEPKVRELATEAGFGSIRRIEMENPFNSLYELRP